MYYTTPSSALPTYRRIFEWAKASSLPCVQDVEYPETLPSARSRRVMLQKIQSESDSKALRAMAVKFLCNASILP